MHAMSIQCKRDNDISTPLDAAQRAPAVLLRSLIKRPICFEMRGVVHLVDYRRCIDDVRVITVTFQRRYGAI